MERLLKRRQLQQRLNEVEKEISRRKNAPYDMEADEIMKFLVDYQNKNKWSSTIQNQLINSIKFFYEQVLKRPAEVYDLPRAQKEYKLPAVFSEE